jgi:hypothetical protein
VQLSSWFKSVHPAHQVCSKASDKRLQLVACQQLLYSCQPKMSSNECCLAEKVASSNTLEAEVWWQAAHLVVS